MKDGSIGVACAGVVLMISLLFALPSTPTPTPATPESPPPTPTSNLRYEPLVFLDQITGCEYLSTHTSATLVPRVAADGKTHMGCKAASP
ncbi:hypothetical protein [Massilia sp. CCM 8734]|uniref:hypothetical protein n=1 Tax=Massilia sp. CCM 8734 TaxID=2609283 RepID=UPI001422807E|nr:hypothetical protein [Massilia sp. CCM 8734]NHZ98062.1 hypothetical protein [Massilia sp. CCM 8734]